MDSTTSKETQMISPWNTGPLIASSGYIFSTSVVNLQSYLYVLRNSDYYDSHWKSHELTEKAWIVEPSFYLGTGITSWMDCSILCNFSYTQQAGVSQVTLSDTNVSIGFQLYSPPENSSLPAVCLVFTETFPTGNYTDTNGDNFYLFTSSGYYESWIGLTVSKKSNFFSSHPMEFRGNIYYAKNSHLKLHGITAYGGAPDTDGTLKPGDNYVGNASMEFSITKQWVLAFDVLYVHQNKFRFSGNSGHIDGEEAVLSFPSSDLVSFAPAIEYNVNLNLGFLLASWFSVTGRNNTQFAGGALTFVYNF
jgi:hypothetical protein